MDISVLVSGKTSTAYIKVGIDIQILTSAHTLV